MSYTHYRHKFDLNTIIINSNIGKSYQIQVLSTNHNFNSKWDFPPFLSLILMLCLHTRGSLVTKESSIYICLGSRKGVEWKIKQKLSVFKYIVLEYWPNENVPKLTSLPMHIFYSHGGWMLNLFQLLSLISTISRYFLLNNLDMSCDSIICNFGFLLDSSSTMLGAWTSKDLYSLFT